MCRSSIFLTCNCMRIPPPACTHPLVSMHLHTYALTHPFTCTHAHMYVQEQQFNMRLAKLDELLQDHPRDIYGWYVP